MDNVRNIKTVEVEKKPIQKLTGDELELLVSFKKSKEYKILEKLADEEKYNRYKVEFLSANSMDEIHTIRGVHIGMDFIMDSVQRAKEELNERGAKTDDVDIDD